MEILFIIHIIGALITTSIVNALEGKRFNIGFFILNTCTIFWPIVLIMLIFNYISKIQYIEYLPYNMDLCIKKHGLSKLNRWRYLVRFTKISTIRIQKDMAYEVRRRRKIITR